MLRLSRGSVQGFIALVAALTLVACEAKQAPAPVTSAPVTLPAPAEETTGTQAAAAATTEIAATTGTTAAVADTGKTVNVFMYSEYIDPALLEKFKAETGITVKPTYYEATEDMLAKMQTAGGDAQYDVVVASDHVIPVMAKLNLIQPIDASQVPNAKNVMKRFASPPYDMGSKYSQPYQWGTMGVIVNKQKVPQYEESWSLFFDEAKQPTNFILIDSMRDMFAAALKFQGKSINSTAPNELKAAAEAIQKAKASVKSLGFEGGAGGKNRVADGSASAAIVYNGDAIRAVDEDKEKKLAFFVPKEGTLIWVDAMVVPAHAPEVAAAHKFINFILDAGNGAVLSNFNKYATPNEASLLQITPEDRANIGIYPSDEAIAKMDFLADVGEATRLYDETWTAIKAK